MEDRAQKIRDTVSLLQRVTERYRFPRNLAGRAGNSQRSLRSISAVPKRTIAIYVSPVITGGGNLRLLRGSSLVTGKATRDSALTIGAGERARGGRTGVDGLH